MARTHVTIEEHEQLRRHFNALARAVCDEGPGAFDRVTKRAMEILQRMATVEPGIPPSSPQDTGTIGAPPF